MSADEEACLAVQHWVYCSCALLLTWNWAPEDITSRSLRYRSALMKHPVVHWSSDTIPNILTGIVNSECTLWVLSKYKDSVPQECLDKHAELCGKGVTLYEKDHCKETKVRVNRPNNTKKK
ncbi:hypothetical protein V5799_017809 [Amblyomma americanum]|uniref:Uncharacterized protein n=1 Tax=Amblyomma americanum TaxID=6943 RepID=A0AAQ4F1P8_AMBAM